MFNDLEMLYTMYIMLQFKKKGKFFKRYKAYYRMLELNIITCFDLIFEDFKRKKI